MSSELPVELHLISRLADDRAWRSCRRRAETGSRVRVVLFHDAVLETEERVADALGGGDHPQVVVLACAADALRRRVGERWALIDYPEIIRSCAAASQVTSW
ncbi:MAG: hypothetical protein ACREN1_01960 [Candidatus Dormibacteria bacterium]